MEQVGTWLVMIGSALAVLQAVWVIAATGQRRTQLLRARAKSDAREKRIEEIANDLRARWGDEAADVSNLEDLPGFEPVPERERLRSEHARLRQQRAEDGWILTYADVERQMASKERELYEVEYEWRKLVSQGALGLLGGILALIGGVLIAAAVS